MLAYPHAALAAAREGEGRGSGWLVFWLMLPFVTLAAGYIVGRERGHGRGKGRRKATKTSSYGTQQDWDDWEEEYGG